MKTIDEASKEYFNLASMDIEQMIEDNDEVDYEQVVLDSFENGVKFAQQWISVKDELPLTYETSQDWDGLRGDVIMFKTKEDYYFGRLYSGFIDGYSFNDFADIDSYTVDNVTHWRPIEFV